MPVPVIVDVCTSGKADFPCCDYERITLTPLVRYINIFFYDADRNVEGLNTTDGFLSSRTRNDITEFLLFWIKLFDFDMTRCGITDRSTQMRVVELMVSWRENRIVI